MEPDGIDHELELIEAGLRRDEPGLEHRLRLVRRGHRLRLAAACGLLVLAVVLLAAGLATSTVGAWCAGAAAFVAALATDRGRTARA